MSIKLVDLLTSGDLYQSSTDLSITYPDGTNATDIVAEFDAGSFNSTGFIGNFNYSHILENENTVYAGNCSVGTYAATADLKFSLSAEMIKSADDLDFIADLIGAYNETEAGTLVSSQAYTVSSGSWTYNTPFTLPYANANGTKVTITSLDGSVDTTLVENTDFFVGLNSNGETTITIIDSTTVTTEVQDMVFDLSYTPASAELLTYESKNVGIPFRAYKFVSCPYRVDDVTNPRQRDYIYFSKVKLGGEIVDNYLKTGETFEGVELTLSGETGGVFVKKIAKGATKTSV